MKRTLLVLLLSTAVAVGSESLEKRLVKRDLLLRPPRAGQTLSQALATLSADYKTRYKDPLRIYVAVELATPPDAAQSKPSRPRPKTPNLEPSPGSDLGATRTHLPTRAPVIELLRYYAVLADVTFTIHGDLVSFRAKSK